MGYELQDCVKSVNGKIYCYDCVRGTHIEFTTSDVEIKDIPLDVIDTWIKTHHGNKQGKEQNEL